MTDPIHHGRPTVIDGLLQDHKIASLEAKVAALEATIEQQREEVMAWLQNGAPFLDKPDYLLTAEERPRQQSERALHKMRSEIALYVYQELGLKPDPNGLQELHPDWDRETLIRYEEEADASERIWDAKRSILERLLQKNHYAHLPSKRANTTIGQYYTQRDFLSFVDHYKKKALRAARYTAPDGRWALNATRQIPAAAEAAAKAAFEEKLKTWFQAKLDQWPQPKLPKSAMKKR